MDIPEIPEGSKVWQRGDGAFIEYLNLENIQRKKDRAEIACIRILPGSATWLRFYEDLDSEQMFIRDFNLMLQELKHLRAENEALKNRMPDQFAQDRISDLEDKIRDLQYQIEAGPANVSLR